MFDYSNNFAATGTVGNIGFTVGTDPYYGGYGGYPPYAGIPPYAAPQYGVYGGFNYGQQSNQWMWLLLAVGLLFVLSKR